jgi:hypothetical protein
MSPQQLCGIDVVTWAAAWVRRPPWNGVQAIVTCLSAPAAGGRPRGAKKVAAAAGDLADIDRQVPQKLQG